MAELIPGGGTHPHLWPIVENILLVISNDIRYYYIFYYRPEVGVCTASWDEPGHQKTPEMSELEADKYALKIWAPNSFWRLSIVVVFFRKILKQGMHFAPLKKSNF